MKRIRALLYVLVIGSLLPATTDAGANKFPDEYSRYVAWGWACELTVDCAGLFPPKVEYLKPNEFYRGVYNGGNTIYVARMLKPGVDLISTLIHEMVHYIHTQNGDLRVPFSPQTVCWSENEAFRLVDLWLDSQGRPELKRGPNWWRSYWHCEPYYDPDWELWNWLQKRF